MSRKRRPSRIVWSRSKACHSPWLAGLVAALAGAIVWAAITVATKFQIGWMAIGVGCLVGYAVRLLGKGVVKKFGIIGGAFSLLGCLLGNLLSGCGFLAQEHSVPVLQVVWAVVKTPALGFELLKATFSPMDVVFYIIAVAQGYQFAFRRIKPEELTALAPST